MPILFNKYSLGTILCVLGLFLLSCSTGAEADVHEAEYPPVFPDYTEVTVPDALAPPRFRVTVPCEKHRVVLRA